MKPAAVVLALLAFALALVASAPPVFDCTTDADCEAKYGPPF